MFKIVHNKIARKAKKSEREGREGEGRGGEGKGGKRKEKLRPCTLR